MIARSYINSQPCNVKITTWEIRNVTETLSVLANKKGSSVRGRVYHDRVGWGVFQGRFFKHRGGGLIQRSKQTSLKLQKVYLITHVSILQFPIKNSNY